MSKHRMVRMSACVVALLAGVWLGTVILPAQDEGENKSSSDARNLSTKSQSGPRAQSPLSRLMSEADSSPNWVEEGEPFAHSLTRLYQQAQSPLRADSEAALFLSESSFEEWEARIANKEVTNMNFLSLLGEHLAQEDPARACQLALSGPFSFNDVAEYRAFVVPLLTAATATHPQLVLEALQNTRPGGNRSVWAQAFTRRWVKADPAAVAQQYSELMELRNDPSKNRNVLASSIVKAWVEKAPEEAADYVENLPDGVKRSTFEQALQEVTGSASRTD